ncbi:MAG: sulfatase-like hydrolase/transferase [Kiritimatiellales bacterium]|nr:sulfatase-like hydrolase/transferase [Kiritimatiellales bacterium]
MEARTTPYWVLQKALLMVFVVVACFGADKPNILWITCEDISPYLGCYGCKEAQTPNLDKLALDGIRYTRAYANAPVCAVARSTLLTGMYASTIGTHQMRSNVQLPKCISAYPKIFREAGYYCTNNSKKDYNSNYGSDKSLWDESSNKAHFKNRQPGQPFFAVFNFTTTHESKLSSKNIANVVKRKEIPATPRINPSDIELPPYHPDLPEIRQDWARLHDLITWMDEQVGGVLADLAEAGLADDTIVFFYSDHGGMLCRSKRYIYSVGTQVPFIVRFPGKWQHLAPSKPGSASDRLVSFIDFPKTALSLAGLPVPELMQGNIFLGPNAEPEEESVHFYRDSMAERFDFSRAVTDGRYYFIRNFMPHRPCGRDTRYGPTVQANWVAWENHYDAGKCDPVQSQFFQPKPLVEFFDTQNDPWHVANLAEQKQHHERMKRLEKDLDQWMIETRDLGLIPEPLFYDLVGPDKEIKTLYEYAQSDRYPVERLLQIAKDTSAGDPKKMKEYLKLMQDENPVVRHWGAYGVFLVRPQEAKVQKTLRKMMNDDPMDGNRIMAAQALGLCGDPEAAFKAIYNEAEETQHGYVFMQAMDAFQHSHTDDRLTLDDWKKFAKKTKGAPGLDSTGFGYGQRIVKDAIAIWPERRKVD